MGAPHTLTARKLFPSCLFPQLTWPVLFSQARTDPGEILPRVICLCDLLGKLLCSSHHCLSFHLQGDTLPVCDTGRFPSKVIPPSHRFSSDGPRQSRTAQTSCLQHTLQSVPAFPQWWVCSPAFFFFPTGLWEDCLYMSLTIMICTWGTSKRNHQHSKRFF